MTGADAGTSVWHRLHIWTYLVKLAFGHAVTVHDEHLRQALVFLPEFAQQLLEHMVKPTISIRMVTLHTAIGNMGTRHTLTAPRRPCTMHTS